MKRDSAPSVPAIVVVGYNRPLSLERLLSSLLLADYPADIKISLVISLDCCPEQDVADAVRKIADNIPWSRGNKEVICHPHQLGLKEHILKCGDLAEKYGSVIVLEDDLFLSPVYYRYASDALKFYRNDSRISGISLYSHQNNPCLQQPFEPLDDGVDNFFLQFASSWGQVWDKRQWSSFRSWYNKGQVVSADDPLPCQVIEWPDTSWLKLFIKYMVESEKTFVYPRVSLSTNFGDPGTHFSDQNSFYQVPILLKSKVYQFISLDDSLSVYDAFFELEPSVLDRLTDRYHGKQYTVDLYGNKTPSKVGVKYMLTTQECISADHTFANAMKPAVLNVMNNVPGEHIRFCQANYVIKDNIDNHKCNRVCNGSFNRKIGRRVFSLVLNKIYRILIKVFRFRQ